MTNSKFTPTEAEFQYNPTFNERELRLFFKSHGEAIEAENLIKDKFGNEFPDCILKVRIAAHYCDLKFCIENEELLLTEK